MLRQGLKSLIEPTDLRISRVHGTGTASYHRLASSADMCQELTARLPQFGPSVSVYCHRQTRWVPCRRFRRPYFAQFAYLRFLDSSEYREFQVLESQKGYPFPRGDRKRRCSPPVPKHKCEHYENGNRKQHRYKQSSPVVVLIHSRNHPKNASA